MRMLKNLMGLAAGVALIASGTWASAQTLKPGYATVIRVVGTASYSLDGGAHKFPLLAGKILQAGSSIYTGDDGTVDVVLGKAVQLPQSIGHTYGLSLAADAPVRGYVGFKPAAQQNVVRVMSSAAFAIDKLDTTSSSSDAVGDTELNLTKGTIYVSVKKMSPAAQYLVKSPTGIAGIRGTEATFTVDPTTGQFVDITVSHSEEGLELTVSFNGITKTFHVNEGESYGCNPGGSTGGSVAHVDAQIARDLRKAFNELKTAITAAAGPNLVLPSEQQIKTITEQLTTGGASGNSSGSGTGNGQGNG